MDEESTLTVKGQVTIPVRIRNRLDLKPGDKLRFRLNRSGTLTVVARRKRSIFDQIEELKLPAIGRPATDADIERAIAHAMEEQEKRVQKRIRR